MQGFPEYAYTTAEKQPDAGHVAKTIQLAQLQGSPTEIVWDALAASASLLDDQSHAMMAAFILGYTYAVNRLPIFIIDPADMLTKETN